MNIHLVPPRRHLVACLCFGLALVTAFALPQAAHAFILTVTDKAGNPLTGGFRWLVEEDTTTFSLPGAMTTNALSLLVHKSYAPVVTNGATDGASITIDLPADKRYMVSVLPNEGAQLGGANVGTNQTAVTVICNKHPVPTAQITIRVFEDNDPIDIVLDPTERGLPGFRIVLKEIAGGADLQDAFGNPLGTTYQTNASGEFILDAGSPIVAQLGSGNILTDANGDATIKNLWPGKFGIEAIAPPGSGWIQTSTLEGGPVQDIRVKANEPPLLSALIPGIPAKHIVIGFVNPAQLPWATNAPAGTNTITGTLRYLHAARPPNFQARDPGPPVPNGLIGLNDPSAPREGRYVTACNPDGTFTITNVPDGTYELFNWDRALSSVVGFTAVTVAGGEIKDIGNILALPFFGTLSGSVFYDFDGDGFRDAGEPGLPRQVINLRWRDASIYQSTQTDDAGNYSLNEVFPWFHYLIAEVDYGRFKATGATIAVDEGGPIPPAAGWLTPSFDVLNPQPQLDMDPLSANFLQPINNPNTLNNLSKTDLDPAPVLLEGMMLFAGQHNVIDWGKANYQPTENGGIAGIVYYAVTRAEDDPRFAAGETWEPGIPHVQVALYQDANNDKVIDDIDGVAGVTRADVDNHPFGWRYDSMAKGPEDVDWNDNGTFDPGDAVNIVVADSFDETLPISGAQGAPVTVHGQELVRNYDNLSAWNQVRPAVFDGGYIFLSWFPGGLANNPSNEESPIPSGNYIVEVAPPPGYELQKEEDKNVDFGDTFTPSPLLLAPEVVGDLRLVPTHLSLFPGVECAFGGQMRPTPDRKLVRVANGRNTPCDFFLFTAVPKAGRAVGWTVNEFAPNPVLFDRRISPAWIPVSFRDWADNEVARVYTDEFGKFNAMLPSTYTINPPTPSGVSPNAIRIVLNDPTMPHPTIPGLRVIDPYFDPNYDQFFFTYEFLAGKTTYTPMFVVPTGAFVGNPDRTLDAEPPDGTPAISAANGPGGGPQVCATNEVLTILAAGPTPVRNPAAGTTNNEPLLITRDYGFGAVPGPVTVGGTPINVLSWSSSTITANVPTGVGSGQLLITRGDNGRVTLVGLSLTVGSCDATVRHVSPAPSPATPIQDAIDAANPGDLILVAPGDYEENVIMWKPIRLQGAGSESTLITGNRSAESVAAWHAKVKSHLGGANPFLESETPGILVLGNAGVPFTPADAPRIDGFGITASVLGSGIRVYNQARFLRISNNKLRGCAGFYGGGITLGTVETIEEIHNDFVTIERNLILKNGGKSGGGIVIYRGAKGYVVKDNVISGNFGALYGAGILHEGLSDGGLIANNTITFNECFVDTVNNGDGGGIFIVGQRLAGALSPGAGNVTISGNLIQGNVASQADGGGISAAAFNGQDVLAAPGNPSQWYALTIINNIIVNNIAGKAGGGISLRDACRVSVINNTVANNDSTASAKILFPPGTSFSTNLPAGLVTYEHTPELATNSGQGFTSPVLEDNIFWHNRSYYYDAAQNGGAGGVVNPNPFFWDLAVSAPAGQLDPRNSILTDPNGYHASNGSGDPLFVDPYTNAISTDIVQDETGTFVDLNPVPLGPAGDYHISELSPARGRGAGTFISQIAALALDFDKQTRPDGPPDAGADEYSTAAPIGDSGSPGPAGDLVGPSLAITSHSNGQSLSASNVTLMGTASDAGRGGSGITNVSVNGVAAAGGNVAGAGTANWSVTLPLVLGPNTFSVVATDGSSNRNTTVQSLTLNVTNLAAPAIQPVVRLSFNEAAGTFATNTGTAGGLFTLTTPRPAFSTNAAPFAGGASSVDFGTVTGNFGVDSPGVLNGLKNLVRFTITGWINNRSSSEGSGGNRVVRWLLNGTGGQGVDLVYHSDGRLDLGVNTTPNSTARSSSGRIPTSSSGSSNNWRFFAVTYDSSLPSGQVQFFFGLPTSDAILDVTRTYSGRGAAGTNIGILTIGHLNPPTRSGSTSRMLRGLVDEIQIFNVVLTPAEIVRLQRTGTSLAPSGPSFVRGFPEAITTYPDTDGIDTDGDGNATNDNVVIHLAAGDGFSKMADGTDIYTFGFSDVTGVPPDEVMGVASLGAEFPAPTIRLKEGQKLFLKLSNVGMMMRPDLFDPHSVHFHGFPNAAPVFDGVPDASMVINMGGTFTYFYNLVTAGTFIYHCHVEATEHMQMGMLGQLYVMPRQNNLPNGTNLRGFIHQTGFKYAYNDGDGSSYYDVDYPIQIAGFDRAFHELHLGIQPLPFAIMKDTYAMLNGRGYPDTVSTNAVTNLNGHASQKINALIAANRGQKILLRISSLATVEFHTLTVQGIPMRVIGKGAALLRGPNNGNTPGKNLHYNTSSITIGGGETADVILNTTNIAPGTYFLYATRLHALSNDQEDTGGLMTEIVIR